MNPTSSTPLHVCIDARLVSGTSGGVEQVLIGLATGLSGLSDGAERYSFVTYADAGDWLTPYVGGRCSILPGTTAPRRSEVGSFFRSNPYLRVIFRQILEFLPVSVPRSEGLVERVQADLIHFPHQIAFLTEVPSIYHPWDLQHLHLPRFFSRRERRRRQTLYRAFCRQARMVSVASDWTRRDVIHRYGLPSEKVQVVPMAPVLTAYPKPDLQDLAETRQKFSLPDQFVLYPAQTWPHKNHLGLLEALRILRDQSALRVPAVFCGAITDFVRVIQERSATLGLSDQIFYLGFVTPLELQCLYRLCRAMIFPSRFEGWGLPITEAFLAGAPVACSNVTSLPDLVGDSAIVFDPDDSIQIAQAIGDLWTAETLRATLIERGQNVARRFSWLQTARLFRAHYRRIADRALTDEDRALLDANMAISSSSTTRSSD